MARRLTFYQVPISPQHVVSGLNRERAEDDPERVNGTRTLDIPDDAVLYALGWEHQGSASPAAGTGILNLLVIETVSND